MCWGHSPPQYGGRCFINLFISSQHGHPNISTILSFNATLSGHQYSTDSLYSPYTVNTNKSSLISLCQGKTNGRWWLEACNSETHTMIQICWFWIIAGFLRGSWDVPEQCRMTEGAIFQNSVNRVSIGSDNGLSPIRHQDIIWTRVGLLSIGPFGRNFNEILINIPTFTLTKMHLNMSFANGDHFVQGEIS